MKLLVDMNLTPRWVAFLSGAGLEAIHWSAIGSASASDTEILSYAMANGLVVLTHDLDFGAILAATGGAKPSVVQIRTAEPNPETVGPLLVAALTRVAEELDQGALLTIDPARARLRLLPLLRGNQ